jgi:hypothetical protein
MSEIAAVLSNFISAWVQTSSGLDFLVAGTMTKEWASAHLPIFSNRQAHTLYISQSVTEPQGHPILCHLGCNKGMRYSGKRNLLKVTCHECKSVCWLTKPKSEPWSRLGAAGLVKTKFPRTPYPVEWKIEKGTRNEALPPTLVIQPPAETLSPSPSATTLVDVPSTSTLLAPPPPPMRRSISLPTGSESRPDRPSRSKGKEVLTIKFPAGAFVRSRSAPTVNEPDDSAANQPRKRQKKSGTSSRARKERGDSTSHMPCTSCMHYPRNFNIR